MKTQTMKTQSIAVNWHNRGIEVYEFSGVKISLRKIIDYLKLMGFDEDKDFLDYIDAPIKISLDIS